MEELYSDINLVFSPEILGTTVGFMEELYSDIDLVFSPKFLGRLQALWKTCIRILI